MLMIFMIIQLLLYRNELWLFVETKITCTSAISHVCIESVSQLSSIYSYICIWIFTFWSYFLCKQGIAEKQRIKEEKEKEDDDVAERDHQLRSAANEEAKVSNVVDSSWYMQLTMGFLLLDRRRVWVLSCMRNTRILYPVSTLWSISMLKTISTKL